MTTTTKRSYQLVPKQPTLKMLKALAGDPLILALCFMAAIAEDEERAATKRRS